MSGLFQLWTERFRADHALVPAAAPPRARRALRPLVMAALLCLTLVAANVHSWAQEQEPEESGLNENSMKKKASAGKKESAVVPPPAGITFTTRLDHTAVWIGDQFHYSIIVNYSPDYDFVLDNLTKETVNMDPLQVMGVSHKTTTLKNNHRRLVVDLTLANFGTGKGSMQIPQFTLYYFRKDHKTSGVEQAAAESLTVPGPVIGLRSTLPPHPDNIRDAVTMNSWARSRWVLPIAGYVCGAIVLIGLAWELALFIKKRKARKGPDRRKAMEAVRARWASGVPADFSDSKAAMEFFNHCYQNVKEYVGYYLETPAMGLTAEELQDEMDRLGAEADFTQKVTKVLSTCEDLRYQRDGTAAHGDTARLVAQDVRDILSSKK